MTTASSSTLNFAWKNPDWRGRSWNEAVIYELHPGAFGGFNGIAAQLPRLKKLGITALELMPVAAFPGARNWGYDGVLHYAPHAAYGTPHELKAMIDTAHGLGLMVFLDVVYNHFGPDGNYLSTYASSFSTPTSKPPGAMRSISKSACPPVLYRKRLALAAGLHVRRPALRCRPRHFRQEFPYRNGSGAAPAHSHGREIHLVLENEGNDVTLLNAGARRWQIRRAMDR